MLYRDLVENTYQIFPVVHAIDRADAPLHGKERFSFVFFPNVFNGSKLNILFFFCSMMALLLVSTASVAASNVISGAVSLPGGDLAKSGGQSVAVWIEDTNGSNFVSGGFSIPEGQSSVTYSLQVPVDPAASWRVAYDCGLVDCAYVRTGYYAGSETVWDQSQAVLLSGGQDHSNIDMTLIEGNSISGTLSMPAGELAPGENFFVEIDAVDTIGIYRTLAKIELNASSASYQLVVPAVAAANWKIRYVCTRNDCYPYFDFAYHGTSGTTWDYTEASSLAGNADHSNIDLTLLYADHFVGTVELPPGDLGFADGLAGFVRVTDVLTLDQFSSRFFIEANQSVTTFDTKVPSLAGRNWAVSYYCNDSDCSAYVNLAYYGRPDMVLDMAEASQFSGGSDYADMALRIVLDLPDSCADAEQQISGPVSYTGDYYCAAETSVTAGTNSVVVANGAYVVYSAPIVELKRGFAVEGQGIFRAGKQLLP